MKRVMHMKKALIVILSLILILGGLFFWKGCHHALYLAEVLEEWMDADDANQSLTLQIQLPNQRQISITADTFWTEYADRPLYGVTSHGVTAWTDGRNLYMDTGNTYALPDTSGIRNSARRLAAGLLLHGRVLKTGDTYNISMKTDELELNIDLTADRILQAADITVVFSDGTAINGSMTPMSATPHPIPREIADAMVLARMEQPMALTEPLEVLLPVLENLLPIEGDLTLGVECGILSLQETVVFRMNEKTAELERKGTIVTVDLPEGLSGADPALLGLVLLRNGAFTTDGHVAQFELTLPADATGRLCAALVPQAANLGITFSESCGVVTIAEGKITSASLTAEGEVPFLITTIPLSFQAALVIS